MDLGTANTIIIKDDKIVLDEPSVVAFDNRTGEMIAVGTKVREGQRKYPYYPPLEGRRDRRLRRC